MSVHAPRFLPLAPRLVALHCSASGPSQWDGYPALVDPDVCWMPLALQGYEGGASWPAGAPTSLAAEARRILRALASSSGEVHLVGHSYGGAVALQVALMWPERIHSVTVYEPVLVHLLQQDEASAPLAADLLQLAAAVSAEVHAGQDEAAAERFVDYWSGPGTWMRVGTARRAALARHMPKVAAEFGALFTATADHARMEPFGPEVRIVTGTASPAPVRAQPSSCIDWSRTRRSRKSPARATWRRSSTPPRSRPCCFLNTNASRWRWLHEAVHACSPAPGSHGPPSLRSQCTMGAAHAFRTAFRKLCPRWRPTLRNPCRRERRVEAGEAALREVVGRSATRSTGACSRWSTACCRGASNDRRRALAPWSPAVSRDLPSAPFTSEQRAPR